MQQTRTTLTTKKRHCKQTSSAVVQSHSAHESSVDVLVGFYMLQVCGHIKHVVVLVALHSCHHFTCCQVPTYVCDVLADFVDSHTAKTGLLRCCLYILSTFHSE